MEKTLEIAIDARHRVRVYAERDCQLAHGRERIALAQRAASNEQPDLFGQLHVDRQRTSAIDLEAAGHGLMLPERLN